MIAKSDLFILIVSSSLLAAGIYRWQHNLASLAPQSSVINSAHNNNTRPPANSTLVSAQSGSAAANSQVSLPRVNATVITSTNPTTISTQPRADLNSPGNSVSGKPLQNTGAIVPTTVSTQPNGPLYGAYQVEQGDYLGKIALTYGTTVNTLMGINELPDTVIEVGQIILYPLPAN